MPVKDKIAKSDRISNAQRRLDAETRIIHAAIGLICRHGLNNFTLADVGQAAGYSRALPAHYFGNKEGLLIRTFQLVFDKFIQGIANQTGHREADVDEYVENTFGLTMINATMPESYGVALLRVYNMVPIEDFQTQLLALAIKVNHELTAMLAQKIEYGIDCGFLRPDLEPKAVAGVILASHRGLSNQQLMDPRSSDFDMMHKMLIRMMCNGLLL